jgi:hypothetical protein
VNPGQIQRLQPEGHGLLSQSNRRLHARRRPLLQVPLQSRLVTSRQRGQLAFHDVFQFRAAMLFSMVYPAVARNPIPLQSLTVSLIKL